MNLLDIFQPRGFALLLFSLLMNAGIGAGAQAGWQEGATAYQRGDHVAAIAEFKPLAERGDDLVQFTLGLMYEKGKGVEADITRAVDWYRRSAVKGHPLAQSKLGHAYFLGAGANEDHAAAVEMLQQAAEEGVGLAHFFLGMIFTGGGRNIRPDHIEAYKRLTLAAALYMSEFRDDVLPTRDLLAEGLTAEQIAEGERLSLEWLMEFYRRKK